MRNTWYESISLDVAYALRALRGSPGFAVGVVLIAGLGIAINTGVFAVLNALFLRPLPVERPQEIVRIYTNESRLDDRYGGSSYPDYLSVRQVPALNGRLAASTPLAVNVRVGGAVVRGEGRLVSENFFDVLGVPAAAGRVFSARAPGAADAVHVVLGHAFWRRHFAANRDLVGTMLEINGASVSVAGVVARSFVGSEAAQVDVYVPIGPHRALAPSLEFLADRGARFLQLIGRVAPGTGQARLASDLNVVMQGLATDYPETNRGRVMTVTGGGALVDTTASPLRLVPMVSLLFSTTGALLLLTTINVAGFLLTRTASRQRELAVRLSLGASRWRIVRQLMVESLVLGIAAEIVALAVLTTLPLVAQRLAIPETVQFGLDVRVLGFASVVTFLTALGFSVGPALRGAGAATSERLRESHSTMPLARSKVQRALVVVQVAMSIVLIGSAVLLAQSIRRLYDVEPGFDVAHVLTAEFESIRGFASRDEQRDFAAHALRQARMLPGVLAASVTTAPPLTSEGMRMSIDIPGISRPTGEPLEVPFSNAGPDYCAALGLTIVDGDELRGVSGATERRAVLVNQTMAAMYWPGRSPVGSTIRLGGSRGQAVPVIGVVADSRTVTLSRPPGPHFLVQSDGDGAFALVMRTRPEADSVKPLVQRAFANGVQGFLLRRVRSMDETVAASLGETRAFAAATSAISLLAFLLAVSGLYALISFLAAQRTREFGIRLALGATRGDVMRLVLSSGARLSGAGVVLGLAATIGSATAMQALIFAVSPLDVVSVAAVATVAGVVAVSACLVPALQAAAVLPATTLRVD